MSTVYQAFCNSAVTFSNNPFLHIPASSTRAYQDTAVDLTYAEAGVLVEGTKALYEKAGYGIGHRVALLLDNRLEFFVHWIALNALGVSTVPVNGELNTEEKAYQLKHSEACLVISLPDRIAGLEAAAKEAGIKLPIINVHDMSGLSNAVTPAANAIPDESTECALLYTSGSTGKPKGCVLDNEYFLSNGRWYAELGGLCELETGKERLLTPLPLVHMNAMAASSMVMIMTGGCIVQLDRFHPRSWWQAVKESEATIVHYLGVLPAILLNAPAHEIDKQHCVKFGFGAGINPKHHKPFEERFGFPLIEAWAMTESGCAGGIIANHEPRSVGTSCIGKPSKSVEIKLVDEQGNEVSMGEPGELLVRGSGKNPRQGFFTEYLKNPEATAEIWADNWLHTGDVVRYGEDGQLHFVDRRKNVIRRSGENISALEVEAALSTHSAIEQLAVAAVPDDLRGDEVMACVVLKPTAEANQESAQAIFKHCYEALVYYKTPGYVAFVEKLPLTAAQKPQRGELKVLCRKLAEEMPPECFDLRDLKRRPKASTEKSATS